eukprot:6879956-Pyramimonas_sp.AAC.1
MGGADTGDHWQLWGACSRPKAPWPAKLEGAAPTGQNGPEPAFVQDRTRTACAAPAMTFRRKCPRSRRPRQVPALRQTTPNWSGAA